MKKPLILLIDDDPALVESLEVLLSPKFEQICRIEAFTDPSEVLAELSRWTEEERPIAVAIVDQKMPGLTGVALIERLRAESASSPPGAHPASRMEAILLTGYAGLPSALEAVNRAGIARYLEKPWSASELVRCACELLRSSFEASGIAGFDVAREAIDPGDVAAALECRLARARLAAPAAGMIDRFDRASRFVISTRSGEDSRADGSMRVAVQGEAEAGASVKSFLESRPELDTEPEAADLLPLPLLALEEIREWIRPFYDELMTNGESVAEPGAIAVGPGTGKPAAIVRLLTDCAMAGMAIWDIDNALVACTPAEGINYRRLGFVPAPNAPTHRRGEPAPRRVCLWGRHDSIPTREIAFRWIVESLRRSGSLCRCPAFPACVPEPFVGGGTGMSDLFCPRLASKIIMGSD